MAGNRITLAAANEVLRSESPPGMIDLWNTAGQLSGRALEDSRAQHQGAVVANLAQDAQRAYAAAAVVGVRPEQFGQLGELLRSDVVTIGLDTADKLGLDLKTLAASGEGILADVVETVTGAIGATVLQAVPVVGAVVGSVYRWIKGANDDQRAWEAAQNAAAASCQAPGYSAAVDRASADAALRRMATDDWSVLFTPECRPFANVSGGWGAASGFDNDSDGRVGFTCCPSPRGRVIAPVGVGLGDRIQSSMRARAPAGFYADTTELGFGLTPMLPYQAVTRAFINAPTGLIETGDTLPLTAGVGARAWASLWSGGPTSFAVDGQALSSAWLEHIQGMTSDILNSPKLGAGHGAETLCEGWSKPARELFVRQALARFGGGTLGLTATRPVSDWAAFAKYQTALLRRLTIAYVDARTCHPAWRARVRQAQRDLLEFRSDRYGWAVCHLDTTAIHDPDYRAAVVAAQHTHGALCAAGTVQAQGGLLWSGGKVTPSTGPSLAPVGDAPALPKPPRAPGRPRAGMGGWSAGTWLAIALGVGVGVPGAAFGVAKLVDLRGRGRG